MFKSSEIAGSGFRSKLNESTTLILWEEGKSDQIFPGENFLNSGQNVYTVLKSEEFEDVYEPAEDSFLLLDALEQDLEELRSANPKLGKKL